MGDCPDCPKPATNPSRDLTVRGWRAWWEDDRGEIHTTTSRETNLRDLPETGFQAMVLYYANGTRRFISGSTWYFFADHPQGLIYGHGEEEPTHKQYPGLFKVCRGRWVPDQVSSDLQKVLVASTWDE